MAVHQLALWHHGYLRISEGQLLLLPIMVGRAADRARLPPLELAGQRRAGDRSVGAFKLRGSRAVPERRQPAPAEDDAAVASAVEREVRAGQTGSEGLSRRR